MSVSRIHRWTLDDATLTDAQIASAGSGLPRRIVVSDAIVAAYLAAGADCIYLMDEVSGTTVNDSSGGGVHGALTANGLLAHQGKHGYGYMWGASGPLVTCPDNAALKPAYNEAFSVSFWWFGLFANSVAVWSCLNPGVNFEGWEVYFDSTTGLRFQFVKATGSNQIVRYRASGISIAADVWHFVTCTYDGSGGVAGLKMYVDGALVTGTSTTGTTITASPDYSVQPLIGARPGPSSPVAARNLIDEAVFYKGTELSAGQVSALYALGASTGRARFTKTFTTDVTVRGIMVPGSTGRLASVIGGSSEGVKGYLSVDGGSNRTETWHEDPAYSVTSVQTLTFDLDFDSTGLARLPWVGGSAGEGPAIVYDEPDPVSPAVVVVDEVAVAGEVISVTFDTTSVDISGAVVDPLVTIGVNGLDLDITFPSHFVPVEAVAAVVTSVSPVAAVVDGA